MSNQPEPNRYKKKYKSTVKPVVNIQAPGEPLALPSADYVKPAEEVTPYDDDTLGPIKEWAENVDHRTVAGREAPEQVEALEYRLTAERQAWANEMSTLQQQNDDQRETIQKMQLVETQTGYNHEFTRDSDYREEFTVGDLTEIAWRLLVAGATDHTPVYFHEANYGTTQRVTCDTRFPLPPSKEEERRDRNNERVQKAAQCVLWVGAAVLAPAGVFWIGSLLVNLYQAVLPFF